MSFGEGPLSQPLLAEAAETLFHPVAIRNNVDGYEAEVLKRFEEPTWNNPVMRFLDKDAKDILPRKDRQWKTGQVLERMTDTLAAAKRDVPKWLQTIATETATGDVETALFAMT